MKIILAFICSVIILTNSSFAVTVPRTHSSNKHEHINNDVYSLSGKYIQGIKYKHKIIHSKIEDRQLKLLIMDENYKIRKMDIWLYAKYDDLDIMEKQVFELLYSND